MITIRIEDLLNSHMLTKDFKTTFHFNGFLLAFVLTEYTLNWNLLRFTMVPAIWKLYLTVE